MTQGQALEILKSGANVFLTGEAGSGKTHVLREYLKYLDSHFVEVGKTASTGIAATHMGGVTIHSWSGIGVKDALTGFDLDDIKERSYLHGRLTKAQVLVIDEISMMHHFRFDMVDEVLRFVRDNNEPFGGLQVVVSGDFFQLPPVARSFEPESRFAYHSRAWNGLDLKVCYLEEQYRQTDHVYNSILNAIRANRVDDTVYENLNSRLTTVFKNDDATFRTRLYTHNIDVDAENERELLAMSGMVHEYKAAHRGRGPLLEALKKSCLAPEILRLKKGAHVMFVKNNFEVGYANGTLGIVEDCSEDRIAVRLKTGTIIKVERESWRIEEDGKIKAEIAQYPLRLAWAITVHKSQGMSLDAAHVDLSKAFEKGMGYVALSRIRTLDGLSLIGFNDEALRVSEEVLAMDKLFREKSALEARLFSVRNKSEIEKDQKEFIKRVQGEKQKKEKKDTVTKTKELIEEGKSLKQISEERGLTVDTILDHIEKIKESDPKIDISFVKKAISASRMQKILSAFYKVGMSEGGKRPLSPVKKILGDSFSFQEIRIARLFL